MNVHKTKWMAEANMIRPNNSHLTVDRNPHSGGVPDAVKLGSAIGKTVRAGAIAVALSQVDGPLPVMDVLAVTYFAASATLTWIDYFSS